MQHTLRIANFGAIPRRIVALPQFVTRSYSAKKFEKGHVTTHKRSSHASPSHHSHSHKKTLRPNTQREEEEDMPEAQKQFLAYMAKKEEEDRIRHAKLEEEEKRKYGISTEAVLEELQQKKQSSGTGFKAYQMQKKEQRNQSPTATPTTRTVRKQQPEENVPDAQKQYLQYLLRQEEEDRRRYAELEQQDRQRYGLKTSPQDIQQPTHQKKPSKGSSKIVMQPEEEEEFSLDELLTDIQTTPPPNKPRRNPTRTGHHHNKLKR